jgi:hypothetical protein
VWPVVLGALGAFGARRAASSEVLGGVAGVAVVSGFMGVAGGDGGAGGVPVGGASVGAGSTDEAGGGVDSTAGSVGGVVTREGRRRGGVSAADGGATSKIVTVGGLMRQSGVAGGVTGGVVATVVVVGSVVPDAFSTHVGGEPPMSGSTGASRSPLHAEVAKSITSRRGSSRMRGTIQVTIRGRGIPYEGRTAGRQLREKLSTGGESGLQAPYRRGSKRRSIARYAQSPWSEALFEGPARGVVECFNAGLA